MRRVRNVRERRGEQKEEWDLLFVHLEMNCDDFERVSLY
jgi:hypothetical protein